MCIECAWQNKCCTIEIVYNQVNSSKHLLCSLLERAVMFKSCGLGGQFIDTRNGHSFSDQTFTQGLKIIGKKPHAFVFCALVPAK